MDPNKLAEAIEGFIPDEGSHHWRTWETATLKVRKGERELIAKALRSIGGGADVQGEDRKQVVDRLGDWILDHCDMNDGPSISVCEEAIGMAYDAGVNSRDNSQR